MLTVAFDEGPVQLMKMLEKVFYTLQFLTPQGNESEKIIRDVSNREYIFTLSYKNEMYDNEYQL